MIEDSAKGIFDVVIVHKLDRFSRDKYDSARYKRKLKQNGIRLFSVTENLDGSPESIILESVIEGMAEYYSKNLAREVMKGMRENALKCQHTGGKPPLGYDVDLATKKYIINEQEATIVKMIFDLYLSGYGYALIIHELNIRGYKTKLNKPFGKNSLHDILANEKYSGTYVFNRASSKDYEGKRNNHGSKDNASIIRVPGGMPAIIDMETFQKAQEKMKANKRQPGAYKAKEIYLLSGLIVCGECLKREGREYSMMGNAKHSGRDKLKHVTYRCGNRERTKQCDNKELRREYIEKYVLSELEKRIFSDKAIPYLVKKLNDYQDHAYDDRLGELGRLEETQADISKQINNIVDAIAKGIGQSALNARLSELEERRAALAITIQELRVAPKKTVVTEETLRTVFAMFRQYVAECNVPEIKKFIGTYVNKVIVYKDHVEVVFSFKWSEESDCERYYIKASVTRERLMKSGVKVA